MLIILRLLELWIVLSEVCAWKCDVMKIVQEVKIVVFISVALTCEEVTN